MVQNFQSTNPITPLGGNGTLPVLPATTITPPTLPSPQDRTPQLLQLTRDSVDRGFQYQASVLETAAQTGQAAAANRTQNSAGGVFGSLLGSIGAGFSLYAELEGKKREAIQVAQAEEAKAAGEALSIQNENLKAQLSIEITEITTQLLDYAGQSTLSEGDIATRRQLVREIATNNELPPAMKAELLRLGYGAIDEVRRGLNTRLVNQFEEVQANQLGIDKQAVLFEIAPLLANLRAGNVGSTDPERVNTQVQQRLSTFFNENGTSYEDRLHIAREVYTVVNDAFSTYGLRATEFATFQELLGDAITEYDSMIEATQGNTEARNFGIQALGAKYAQLGLSGIDWTGIEVTESERIAADLQRREYNRILAEDALRDDPVVQQFKNAVAWQSAYNIFTNPGNYTVELQRLRESDDVLDRAVLENINTLSTVRAGRIEIAEQRNLLPARRSALNVQMEAARTRFDPSGRLGPVVLTDQYTQSLIQAGESQLERGRISREEFNAIAGNLRDELNAINFEERTLNQRALAFAEQLAGSGINYTMLTNYDANARTLNDAVQSVTPAFNQRQQELLDSQSNRNDPSNFSAGPAVSTPPVVPLATNSDGVTFPAAAGELRSLRVTSPYGDRMHPIHGVVKFHQGIDVVIPSGNVLTIAGGVVIHASAAVNGGWGGLVTVRTPDGFVEQFNHLRALHVSPGQVIPPGTQVGLMGGGAGDPHPGDSTGRHLDFRVVRAGTPDDQVLSGGRAVTMNPVDYMRMRGQQVDTPLSVGRPANQPAPGNGNPLLAGQQLWQSIFGVNSVNNQGTVNRGNGTGGASINNTSQIHNTALASTRRNAYREGMVKNDGEANHGYDALRNNRDLRIAVHQTSSRLGIPSQWLADLIDYETAGSWSPSVPNGLGCVGLQFCPSGELQEVANQRNTSLEGARQYLASIGLVGQLKYLEAYFMRYANGGRDLTSISALYAGWNGGPSRIRNPQSLPSDGSAASAGARRHGSALNHHLMRLGNRTGRRYDLQSSIRGADLGHAHTSPVGGCTLCNEQLAKLGRVTPHIGQQNYA